MMAAHEQDHPVEKAMDEKTLTLIVQAVRRIKQIQANPPTNPEPLTKERMEELVKMVMVRRLEAVTRTART
jgi:hypothetical protein